MKQGLDAYKLKLIALAFMILDHVDMYLNRPLHEAYSIAPWPDWIGVTTRFVSPLFLYLMIDGFYHTRDRKKFLTRLTVTAIVMWAGNAVINYTFHNVDYNTGKMTFGSLIEGQNIFLTLAVLFAFVWCLENIKQRQYMVLSAVLAPVLAVVSLSLGGGLFLLPIAFLAWFFHGKKAPLCIGIAIWCCIILAHAVHNVYMGYVGGVSLYTYLCFNNEWAMAFMIPLVLLYNGERGKNTAFTKYLFYVIYPVHLWILMIMEYLLTK